ncbi:MAG: hypothetical protein ABW127_13575 [Candidatus Thiodiazotropha endolucinida]
MSRYIVFLVDFFRQIMRAMNGEVHVFGVEATVLDGNQLALPAGERRAVALFMRQKKGTDHDWDLAEKTMSEAGWGNIKHVLAKRITLKGLNGKAPLFTDCYEDALVNGSALLVYQDIEVSGESSSPSTS